MTTLHEARLTALDAFESSNHGDDAELAVGAFLARYSGRTFEAYRHDLRTFFSWAGEVGLRVLEAKRPHIELYRSALEERGLAPSTIDRRLSTVCGFCCFAHIDGRISANPAQYVRRPRLFPSERRGLDRSELGTFLFTAEHFGHDHVALALLLGLNGLRVSEACMTNVEDLGFDRGHRTLQIMGKGAKPATIPLVPRVARQSISRLASEPTDPSCAVKTASDLIVRPHIAGSNPSGSGPSWAPSIRTCFDQPSSWRPSYPAFPCETSRSLLGTPIPGRPRSMTAGEKISTDMPPTWSWRSSPGVETPPPPAAGVFGPCDCCSAIYPRAGGAHHLDGHE